MLMRISDFNAKAVVAVANFKGALDKLLNSDVAGLNLKELRNSVKSAMTVNSEMNLKLTSLNKAQLLKLRANTSAVGEYTTAVDNVSSLNNLLPVLLNFLNEEIGDETPEESIDAILGDTEEENCGDSKPVVVKSSKNDDEPMAGGGDPEEAIDDLLTGNSEGEVSAEQESADNIQAAVEEGTDVSNALSKDAFAGFARTAPAATKRKPNPTTNSSGIVPVNFLA